MQIGRLSLYGKCIVCRLTVFGKYNRREVQSKGSALCVDLLYKGSTIEGKWLNLEYFRIFIFKIFISELEAVIVIKNVTLLLYTTGVDPTILLYVGGLGLILYNNFHYFARWPWKERNFSLKILFFRKFSLLEKLSPFF